LRNKEQQLQERAAFLVGSGAVAAFGGGGRNMKQIEVVAADMEVVEMLRMNDHELLE
jgi:hypothetical protein